MPNLTFIEALNNPETRAMIDAIEDLRASLDGKEDDVILQDCLRYACAELMAATGIDLN